MQKVILVTGASSGIGEATALALADAGHRVFAAMRSAHPVPQRPEVTALQMDVRDAQSVDRAVRQVLHDAGRIDVVVNNAGISLAGPIEATSDAEAMALFDTNLFGVLRVCRAVLPTMRAQRSGLIVNVSSVLGFLPAPFMGLYCASKHAVEGLSESLDHEVRGFGVRVTMIEPSFTNTKLDTNARPMAVQLSEYQADQTRTIAAVKEQIASAPPPSSVAAAIVETIGGPHRLRRPADKRARLLAFLRRFAPAGQVDKSLRSSFGL